MFSWIFYDEILTNVNQNDPLQSDYEKLQNRSSRPEVFGKKGVLRNFAKFTGKHQC